MIIDVNRIGTFFLDPAFLERYQNRSVRWGFGAFSWVTFQRTYSREGESWWETCRRVIEGTLTIERFHCLGHGLPWDEEEARRFAEEAYDRMWRFLWTPSGRGLWVMGTRFLYESGAAALNNCGFVSTKDIDGDYAEPFVWMLEMTMLGVGVGYDTRGVGKRIIAKPARSDDSHIIEDTREGWADALRRLLDAYVGKGALPARWDLSRIRPTGTPLKRFGGYASGPGPLREMLESVEALHEEYVGRPVDARLLVDTMSLVGRAVVAGGTRRSAQIAFGAPSDAQFLDLKQDPEKVLAYRWVSNHSIFADVGMDYTEAARRTARNGEPGYLWLENARRYGRLLDPPDGADEPALGSNPCVEQTLWDHELCCLVETYPAHHDSFEDYQRTLEIAYRYAKAVTLVPTHNARTNAVMMQNRRLGCSMTGIVQAIAKLGYRRFFEWCDQGYAFLRRLDEEHSRRLGVPRSIKITSVKPSGTISLLAGATPGVHFEHAPYYIRRIRVRDDHPLVEMCSEAGYPIEPDRYASHTVAVSFPVRVPHVERRKADVPIWEKVDLAAQMQRYWSDNQVSCTAEFDPERERDAVTRVLSSYEDRLKAISFLPAERHGYPQPPYEEISEDEYQALVSRLRPIRGYLPHEQEVEAAFCEGGTCELS